MIRTHTGGSLRASDAGTTVTLAGWIAHRRDHGGVAFLDLRDASGIVQVVVRDESVAHGLRNEYCLTVTGQVSLRPEGNANPNLATGEVEVIATEVIVLSEAAPLPFPIDDHGVGTISEEARLKYRYLDLRRAAMAANMRLRSRVTHVIREVMEAEDFLDVETPYLTRSTPEGARDFLVPVRLQPGTWYALPQSPQLFKQLLMVAGLERYYQIARCFRDEDFRADRQPEFTQLDVEMSFCTRADVVRVTEKVLRALWSTVVGHEIPNPIPHMTWHEAERRFGSDKPDLRFGCELVDLTAYFARTEFRVFQAGYVGAVVMPGGAAQTRRELDGWQDWAKSRGAKGLAYVTVGQDGTLGGVAKNLSETERDGLAAAAGAGPGDCIFLAAGEWTSTVALLGAARLEIGKRCGLIDESRWEFVWIVDAPMFEKNAHGGWTAVHHPFTSPTPEFVDTFDTEPGRRAVRRLRHRAERLGDRRRVDPYPPQRRPGPGLRTDRPEQGPGRGPVRLPARGLRLRASSARRHRARPGPRLRAAGRRGDHPRRHRLPEDRLRRRPPHRRPVPDHPGPAQRGRHRRPSARLTCTYLRR